MERHVTILGAFHIAFGALGLVAALAILLIFGGAAGLIALGAASDPDALIAAPIVGIVGTVLMLADNLKRGELETTLFGQPVRTARGAVSLALRTRAPVLPVYLVRGYSGRLRLVIEPEMEMERTGDLGADVAANTGRIMRLLEDLVRRYPDQWYWLTVDLPRRDGRPPPKDVA